MNSRRLLLILGISLLVAAIAASFVPLPEEEGRERPGEMRSEQAEPVPALDPDGGETIELAFSAKEDAEPGARGSAEPRGGEEDDGGEGGGDDAADAEPATETVGLDDHVIVTVRAPDPGDVELDGLGLLQPVSPGVPAVFDLFTDSPGRYVVLYTPVEGLERQLGTLVVEPSGAPRAGD